jgi:hypothetical protein
MLDGFLQTDVSDTAKYAESMPIPFVNAILFDGLRDILVVEFDAGIAMAIAADPVPQ